MRVAWLGPCVSLRGDTDTSRQQVSETCAGGIARTSRRADGKMGFQSQEEVAYRWPLSGLSRRRAQAGAMDATRHAGNIMNRSGMDNHAAAAHGRLRAGVGYPAAFQCTGSRIAEPLCTQRLDATHRRIVMRGDSGNGMTHTAQAVRCLAMMKSAGRTRTGRTQLQLVHDSPRQAPRAAREVSRTFLVVESTGQPHAVAVRAYVGYMQRQHRTGASEAGASTRRVTVHFSWLG